MHSASRAPYRAAPGETRRTRSRHGSGGGAGAVPSAASRPATVAAAARSAASRACRDGVSGAQSGTGTSPALCSAPLPPSTARASRPGTAATSGGTGRRAQSRPVAASVAARAARYIVWTRWAVAPGEVPGWRGRGGSTSWSWFSRAVSTWREADPRGVPRSASIRPSASYTAASARTAGSAPGVRRPRSGTPSSSTSTAPAGSTAAAAHHGCGSGIPLPSAAETSSSSPAAEPRGPVALSAPETNAVTVSPAPRPSAPTWACWSALPISMPSAEAGTAVAIRRARSRTGSTRSFMVACIAPSPANTPRSTRCASSPAASASAMASAARAIGAHGSGGRAGRAARAHQGVAGFGALGLLGALGSTGVLVGMRGVRSAAGPGPGGCGAGRRPGALLCDAARQWRSRPARPDPASLTAPADRAARPPHGVHVSSSYRSRSSGARALPVRRRRWLR